MMNERQTEITNPGAHVQYRVKGIFLAEDLGKGGRQHLHQANRIRVTHRQWITRRLGGDDRQDQLGGHQWVGLSPGSHSRQFRFDQPMPAVDAGGERPHSTGTYHRYGVLAEWSWSRPFGVCAGFWLFRGGFLERLLAGLCLAGRFRQRLRICGIKCAFRFATIAADLCLAGASAALCDC
jgi:hypothetical protein